MDENCKSRYKVASANSCKQLLGSLLNELLKIRGELRRIDGEIEIQD
jgi:hypothetical protein